jgi:O-antigen ligase
VGTGLVVVLGAGLIAVPVALIDREPALAGVAAAVAAAALVLLVTAGWIGPFGIVLATLPLPAVLESESLRITLAAPVTAMVAFGWFVGAVLRRRSLVPAGLPIRSAVLLAMAFVLATLFAQHPLVSVREVINLGVLGALLFLSINVFEQTPGAMRQVARLMVVVGSVCGAFAVLEGVGVIPGAFPRSGSGLYRAALGFGQPNALGLFLVVVFPFALLEVSQRERPGMRWAAGLAVTCILGGLLFTFSRGSWLSVLAGMSALVLVGRWRWVLRAWVVAIVFLLIVDVGSGGLLRDTVQRTIGDWVVEQRALLMLAGVSMFFAYPMLGVGPGGFAESLDRVGAQIPALVDFKPTPHNAYVQVAAEAGIVGLAAYALFVAAVLAPLVRTIRSCSDQTADDADRRGFGYAVVWSAASILASGMVIWPLAHGAGQAVIFVVAMACAIPIMARHHS